MVADPWSCGSNHKSPNSANLSEFEDNFTPSLRDTLPDSDQYLATLEKKLKAIKNDPDILSQLRDKREAYLQNFLNSEPPCEDNDLESAVPNSQILRTILPQKQALNKGELVELIEYDQLEGNSTDSEKSE